MVPRSEDTGHEQSGNEEAFEKPKVVELLGHFGALSEMGLALHKKSSGNSAHQTKLDVPYSRIRHYSPVVSDTNI